MLEQNKMEITEGEAKNREVELQRRARIRKNNFVLQERLIVEGYLDLIPPGSMLGKDGERYRLLIQDERMENKIGVGFVADSFYALWDSYLAWLDETEAVKQPDKAAGDIK